jgi:PAS domain S-box-containing protein
VTFEIDRQQFWASILVQRIRDPDGGYTRALAISRDITDRKRAEIALRENDERLRQIIRVSHIGVFDLNHLTGAIYWSAEQREIFGWGPNEQVILRDPSGRDPQTWDLIHPLDRERAVAALKHSHESADGVVELEYRIIRRDGTLRWLSTHAQTLFEDIGGAREPVRMIGTVQDITERKRAERHLLLTQTSIQKSSVAIFWFSPSAEVTYANERACASLGRTCAQLVGCHAWEFDPDMTPERWQELLGLLKKEGSGRAEAWLRRQDGSIFPVEVTVTYVVYEGEEQIVAFMQDMTERKKAEQALAESEERLRQVAVIYNIGVFDHDHISDTIYWSQELREYLELPPGEVAGPKAFVPLIYPEDFATVEAAVRRAHDPAGDGHYAVQHRIVTPNGTLKWLDTRSQTFFASESGTRYPRRTVGAMVDITARMEAQEALRVSVREKEILLREVHHRVKNNLQIISSVLHFQAKKVKTPEALIVFNEARDRLRAMILVHDKLYKSEGLTRIECGPYIHALVHDLWRSYATIVSGRISVHVDADPIALPIESALPCGMIVCELLTNSVKYAFPNERRGEIRVALTAAAERVTLSVSDDGIGLPVDFDATHATTFGWQLISNLAAQLNATLTATGGNGGTHVTLHFRSEPSHS